MELSQTSFYKADGKNKLRKLFKIEIRQSEKGVGEGGLCFYKPRNQIN